MGNACSNKDYESEACLNNDSQSEADKIFLPLTENEIILLRVSWSTIKFQWKHIFNSANARWLQQYPELLPLFTNSPSQDDCGIHFSTKIQTHMVKFSEFLEICIYKLDQQPELVQSLIDQGVCHHMFGAQQKYATALATGLKLSICEFLNNRDVQQDRDYETQNAWDSFFRFISGLLKYGMRKAIMEKQKTML